MPTLHFYNPSRFDGQLLSPLTGRDAEKSMDIDDEKEASDAIRSVTGRSDAAEHEDGATSSATEVDVWELPSESSSPDSESADENPTTSSKPSTAEPKPSSNA